MATLIIHDIIVHTLDRSENKKMAERRKYDSGAQKRKTERIKEQRQQNLLRQIPKLTGYFKPGAGSNNPHIENNVDNDLSDGAMLTGAGAIVSSTAGTSSPTLADDTFHAASDPPPVAVSDGTPAESPVPVEANLSPDPGCWGEIDENARKYWITMGPDHCRNKDADVAASERQHKQQKRYFSKSLFMRKLANGEIVNREWLIYSPSRGTVFCFACKLFGTGSHAQLSPLSPGFSDWKNAGVRLPEHEMSKSHKNATMTYLKRSAANAGCIDHGLKQQFDSEHAYWKEVLRRVVVVVRHLSERGLAFRGKTEIIGRSDNGNFLGTLEVISEFDPFLKAHMEKFGNAGKGTPSYLSSTICQEFIELMGDLHYVIRKTIPYSDYTTITAGLEPNENQRIETLKSLSDTRWTAHTTATKALCQNYANIQQSLLELSEDSSQHVTTKREAVSLSSKMEQLENAFLCNLWNNILQRFHRTSAVLQAVDLDLSNAVDLVGSLRGYVANLRDDFDKFENAAKKMSPSVSQSYKADTQRQRKRTKKADEPPEPDSVRPGRDKFRTTVFIAIIDRLLAEIDRRYDSYKNIRETFGFLSHLSSISLEDLRREATTLQEKYIGDLEADFVEEIVHFREYVKESQGKDTSAGLLLRDLRERNLQTAFPNVDIALRLFMTLPVTNASGERSFSKLGLIKNRLRSTMGQNKLNHLTLMSLESDILRKLDFTSLINDFTRKARKANF
uniref:TTF-type domain-containing protein n=1 Tax=Paramormyrops kingsleyae TaxID=1676925 RepID=A0A3B3QZT7_9TELE